MRLEQLQAFLTVAQTQSFQQAARQCAVTQSTISRQIQNLETELGAVLFHRSNAATLTAIGEQFLPRAQRICREWQTATDEIADLLNGKQPELCVAAIHSVCARSLPPVLQQFCRDYPNVQLRVTSLGSDRALKVLKDGLVDLAIVMNNRFLTTSAELVVDSLYTESVRVLMSANHPLTQYSTVSWEQLAQFSHVVFKDGYGMQRLVQEQFNRQGITLNVAMELNTLDAFRGIVRQGELVALLPASAVVDVSQDKTLAVRDTEFPILQREVVLVTTCDRLKIPPIAHFRTLSHQLLNRQFDGLTMPDPAFNDRSIAELGMRS
jgi:DNA-binding transcriptional LysR family regulator